MPSSVAGARLPLEQYVDGVLRGNRVVLARAITLVESRLAADIDLAVQLLEAVLPHAGRTRRIGITGVPGVGKSTFIDALGMFLISERGERVAVLSVDPSSPLTRGSILGDKTRMERLAADERAFIRPSPSGGHAGGVAPRTREAVLLCEAAGFRNIIIETVGVGQSETAVHAIADFFLLLMLAGAGDELQGIKRGILEMADGLAITKADGENVARAERAQADYASALRLFPASPGGWTPRVLCCSALENTGIAEVWQMVLDHEAVVEASGSCNDRRALGEVRWMHELIASGLTEALQGGTEMAERVALLEQEIRAGRTTPLAASRRVLDSFDLPAKCGAAAS